MNSDQEKLASTIATSNKMVFFGGAGLSTESGIPDFRSAQGLFNQGQKIPPEKIVSRSYFLRHPDEFFNFYREKLVHLDAKPNPAHYALAELEKQGVLQAIITQNVDGLHRVAGSKKVIELHGSIYRNYCVSCDKEYPIDFIMACDGAPHCDVCGSIVRPDVVLYGESLRKSNIIRSMQFIAAADTLLIGGTSLFVSPAANLIDHFEGDNMVIINKDAAAFDDRATLTIQAPIGEMLGEVVLSDS